MKELRALKSFLTLAAVLGAAGAPRAGDRPSGPPFKYVGGTQDFKESCEGNLELGLKALTFRCATGSISVPYEEISLMQYRPDVSRKIWKMKLKWKLKPAVDSPLMGGKRNRYFSVIYSEQNAPQALILAVLPSTMRPYLAEIDLKAGKRVEVKAFEEYD